MPCEIAWGQHGVYRRLHGTVTYHEIMTSIEQVGADSRFDELRYSINDFSTMSGSEVTDTDLEAIAAVLYGQAQTNSRILIAIVTSEATARMLAERLGRLTIATYAMQVFPTVANARAWINRELPLLNPLQDVVPRFKTA